MGYQLPVVKISGKGAFYLDERLKEFRNVSDPGDVLSFDEFDEAEDLHIEEFKPGKEF